MRPQAVCRQTVRLHSSAPDRALLADDQELVRAGLRMMVDSAPDLTVVGEAATGRQAIRLAKQESSIAVEGIILVMQSRTTGKKLASLPPIVKVANSGLSPMKFVWP